MHGDLVGYGRRLTIRGFVVIVVNCGVDVTFVAKPFNGLPADVDRPPRIRMRLAKKVLREVIMLSPSAYYTGTTHTRARTQLIPTAGIQ